MQDDCIFCKIARGDIPCDKVFESEEIIAFKDIRPAAPVHVLVLPKEHIPTLNDVSDSKLSLIGKMIGTARDLAKQLGIAESGYRTIINCNRGAGQEVFHIHLHILGGRKVGAMG